ncbi:hypothetical protein AGMMS49579_22970 [Spirochaetia bacterium]|nr:hypothetical protein AGMMS49579_22970 [Spirochaetia bacterium]
MKKPTIIAGAFILCAILSCEKSEEYSPEEFEALHPAGLNELLAKTVSKPWEGQDFVPGKLGGTWHSVMQADPKSFNRLVAEHDAETRGVVDAMLDYLIEYDPVARDWKPRAASFEVKVDEAAGKLSVIFTLRDNLYWSYYNSATKIPVTSDDVIFWYNGIWGDPEFQSSGYYQEFLTMEDGSKAHVDIEKLSDKSFALHFPRIIADPLLASNMNFGPAHIYKKAAERAPSLLKTV